MPEKLRMIRPYISDPRTGDGYRAAFILKERGPSVLLYVPSLLLTVSVPKETIQKARPLPYRPRVVRTAILKRAKLYRRHGYRFPRQATVEVLQKLGAGRAAIVETVKTEPLREVIVARQRRIEQAERAAEMEGVVTAIRERIDWQLAQEPLPRQAPRPGRPRTRYVHPDQLALAL